MCMRSVCMCVCVCPWVPACLYMSVCMCTCACGSVLMCACVSLCISVCTWVCMYVSVCPSVSLCACVFVHMGLYACVSVCPCVSVHVCMCTWVLCTCVCVSECVSVCMSVWAWVSLCMCPCAYVYMWVSRCALLSVLPFVQDPSPAQPLSSHLGMKGLRHVQGLRTVSPWTSDEGHALRRRLNLNPRSFKDAPCPEDRFKGSSRPVWATAGPSGLLVKRQFGDTCYLILSWNDSFEGVRWVFCPGPEASFCTWRGQAIMLRTQPRRRWGGKALETPSQVGRLRLWQGRLAGAPRGSAVSVGTPCCLAPSGLQGHLPQTSVGGAGKEVSKVKPWLWEGRRAGGEGAAEDGMAWWHHRLSGHQTNSGSWWRTGSLACCSPRSHKESDMTERQQQAKLRWPVPMALTGSDQRPHETGSAHRHAQRGNVCGHGGAGGGGHRADRRGSWGDPGLPTPGRDWQPQTAGNPFLLFKLPGPGDFGRWPPNTVPDRIQPRPEVLRVSPLTPKRWPRLLECVPSQGTPRDMRRGLTRVLWSRLSRGGPYTGPPNSSTLVWPRLQPTEGWTTRWLLVGQRPAL